MSRQKTSFSFFSYLFSLCFFLSFLFFLVPFFSYAIFVNDSQRLPKPPYITGDGFRAHSDFIFDETNQTFNPILISDGDIIFVKTDLLAKFFRLHHSKIKHRYILISHNADDEVPLSKQGDYTQYLNDEKILVWFAQNVNQKHPKLIPIPIGLENRYCAKNKLQIIDNYKTLNLAEKNYLLYMNFSLNTYPKERKHIYNMFKNKSFCKATSSIAPPQFYDDVFHSRFVLSPRGNGVDCHRTWEVLYLKSIPVVRSSAMDSLYQDLPVLIVKDWEEITEDLLRKKAEEVSQKTYNFDKLSIDYWYLLIDCYKNSAKANPCSALVSFSHL